jgi:PAS domain S-box-containing protein
VSQQPVELILIRHLASRLAVPVFVIDEAGDLVYFNEPAEQVLGRRFEEIRSMPFNEWTTAFVPATSGRRLDPEELPLVLALRRQMPAHSRMEIVAGDGARRSIEVTAFPIVASGSRQIGAVAMFWEPEER